MSCYVGEWSVVPVRSDSLQQIPAARCGHTLTAIGSDAANQKLLLIGGQSGLTHNREFLSDMHLFDPARAHWSPLRASSRHKWLARADHAAAAFGPGAVAFGGRHGDTYLSDTTLFRLDDGEEKEVSIVPLFCPSTPCARRGASLQLSRDGASFLLFGGQAGALFLADLWRLDAAQGGGARWVREACGGGKGGGPTARAFHASFLDASGNLVVLGGVQSTKAAPAPPAAHSFDPRAGRWSRLTPADGDHLSKPLAMGHVQAHRLADRPASDSRPAKDRRGMRRSSFMSRVGPAGCLLSLATGHHVPRFRWPTGPRATVGPRKIAGPRATVGQRESAALPLLSCRTALSTGCTRSAASCTERINRCRRFGV
eukprot:861920_1